MCDLDLCSTINEYAWGTVINVARLFCIIMAWTMIKLVIGGHKRAGISHR